MGQVCWEAGSSQVWVKSTGRQGQVKYGSSLLGGRVKSSMGHSSMGQVCCEAGSSLVWVKSAGRQGQV